MTSDANSRYAVQALAHWRKWRPTELAQITDPETFFADLGQQVQQQVDQLASDLAGKDVAGEDYLAKVGRLRMARFDAEAQVLRELLPPPERPEEATASLPARAGASESRPGESGPAEAWLPTVLTPDHPRYHELDEDPGLQKA